MELGGRHAAGFQPSPKTQRAKSSVVVLLPQRIVLTRRPAKRSRFNNRPGHAPAQGLPQSSSAAR